MSDRSDFSGVERELREIASNTRKPFQDMHEREQHKENIKMQNELLNEQTRLVKWTIILAVSTVIMALGTLYMAYAQAPMPKLLLDVQESTSITCDNGTLPYGTRVKIANVGTRSSVNTQLIISYEDNGSFYDAFFVKFNRIVNQTNPNTDLGWLYSQEADVLGYPYWVVHDREAIILLNEIEPGEHLDLIVRFNGKCGTTKKIQFKVIEDGYYFSSSSVKSSKISWYKVT